MNFEQFIQFFVTTGVRNQWIEEPGIRIYVRRSLPLYGADYDLSSMEADEPGQGSLTAFLNRYESLYSFYVENILEPRLVGYFERRGYLRVNGGAVGNYNYCMTNVVTRALTQLRAVGLVCRSFHSDNRVHIQGGRLFEERHGLSGYEDGFVISELGLCEFMCVYMVPNKAKPENVKVSSMREALKIVLEHYRTHWGMGMAFAAQEGV